MHEYVKYLLYKTMSFEMAFSCMHVWCLQLIYLHICDIYALVVILIVRRKEKYHHTGNEHIIFDDEILISCRQFVSEMPVLCHIMTTQHTCAFARDIA